MDRFTALKVFCAVVEAKSFTKAGINIGLSRSAISKNIRELEIHLGATLLNRTTRGISITDIGSQYYNMISELLSRHEQADDMIVDERRSSRGTLRLTVPVTMGLYAVLPLLSVFTKEHPQIALDLSMAEEKRELVEGNFDIAIRGSYQLQDSTLISRRIGQVPYTVCASPAYLESAPVLEHPNDLCQHLMLIHGLESGAENWNFRSNAEEVEVTLHASHRSNCSLAIKHFLLEGMGVARVPRIYVADKINSGELVEVLEQWELSPLSVWAIYPNSEFVPRRTRVFIDFMLSRFMTS